MRATSLRSFSRPRARFISRRPFRDTTGTPSTSSTRSMSQFSKTSTSPLTVNRRPLPSDISSKGTPAASRASARAVVQPRSRSWVSGLSPYSTMAPPATSQYSSAGQSSTRSLSRMSALVMVCPLSVVTVLEAVVVGVVRVLQIVVPGLGGDPEPAS